MRIEWEYMELSGGVRILRALGEAECLEVPEEIGGLPVTEIGPYAFSSAELPRRFWVGEEKKRRTQTGEWEVRSGVFHEGVPDGGSLGAGALAGSCLRAVRLPASLRVIGDYAFYGCRELKEIAFADSLERIGSGAFMGCSGVDRLECLEAGAGGRGLYQMLSELRYAMEVVIRRREDEVALMVPEYYESSVENIPARILELHYQGTGYRYRQCFRDGSLDYRSYDDLFGLAESQEPPEVLARLAYDRLRYPEGLSDEARKVYLEWFSANVQEAGEYFLKRDDLPAISLVCEAGGFEGKAKRRCKKGGNDEGRRIVADGAGDFYMASMGEHVLGEMESEQGGETGEGSGCGEGIEYGKGFGSGAGSEASLDVLLEMAGRMGRAEIVSYLMDYRHRKQGSGRRKVFEL